jgi:large subunit ribosomal protein L29
MAKASTVTKMVDLRGKSPEELRARLGELRKEQFNLRIQKATGQLANVGRVSQVRKEVAQVLTLLNEAAKGKAPTAPKKKTTAKKAA